MPTKYQINKAQKRSRESKSGQHQIDSSFISPPGKSHKTASNYNFVKESNKKSNPNKNKAEALKEVIEGAKKGLKKVPSPVMATSSPELSNVGSSINVNEIMGITPDPEDKIDVWFLPKSPREDLTKKCCIKLKSIIKSVVPNAHVTFPNKSLTVTIKRAELDTLRGITSLDGVEVKLDDDPAGVALRKFSWGKIYAPLLFHSEVEAIVDQLNEENNFKIEEVKRQMKGEAREPTRLLKIKFQLPAAPHTVYCLGEEFEVEKYFPPPRRCTKCQMFGHWQNNCRGPTRCAVCGQTHSNSLCTNLPTCYNCHRSHPASDPNCPMYRQEKDIILLSYENDISFPAARNLFNEGTRPANQSAKPKPKPPAYDNPYVKSVESQTIHLEANYNIKEDSLEDKTIAIEDSDIILYPTPPSLPSPPIPQNYSPDNLDLPWSPSKMDNPLDMLLGISSLNRAMSSRTDKVLQNDVKEELRLFNNKINSALAAVHRVLKQQNDPYSNPDDFIDESNKNKAKNNPLKSPKLLLPPPSK